MASTKPPVVTFPYNIQDLNVNGFHTHQSEVWEGGWIILKLHKNFTDIKYWKLTMKRWRFRDPLDKLSKVRLVHLRQRILGGNTVNLNFCVAFLSVCVCFSKHPGMANASSSVEPCRFRKSYLPLRRQLFSIETRNKRPWPGSPPPSRLLLWLPLSKHNKVQSSQSCHPTLGPCSCALLFTLPINLSMF